jgi:hypothetical protein
MFLDMSDYEVALIENLEPHIRGSFIDNSVFMAAVKASREF